MAASLFRPEARGLFFFASSSRSVPDSSDGFFEMPGRGDAALRGDAAGVLWPERGLWPEQSRSPLLSSPLFPLSAPDSSDGLRASPGRRRSTGIV